MVSLKPRTRVGCPATKGTTLHKATHPSSLRHGTASASVTELPTTAGAIATALFFSTLGPQVTWAKKSPLWAKHSLPPLSTSLGFASSSSPQIIPSHSPTPFPTPSRRPRASSPTGPRTRRRFQTDRVTSLGRAAAVGPGRTGPPTSLACSLRRVTRMISPALRASAGASQSSTAEPSFLPQRCPCHGCHASRPGRGVLSPLSARWAGARGISRRQWWRPPRLWRRCVRRT
mmetsp:Transcript_31965/g.85364  ORF Transcript_31965/g.85364 Transcript_31965/m.85364 type:complete len:231 (-) Transcript_31965:1328-2020(-)